MTKHFKITATLIIIAGVWLWKQKEAQQGQLKYQDLAVKDPYEALVHGTGGKVFKFEKW